MDFPTKVDWGSVSLRVASLDDALHNNVEYRVAVWSVNVYKSVLRIISLLPDACP